MAFSNDIIFCYGLFLSVKTQNITVTFPKAAVHRYYGTPNREENNNGQPGLCAIVFTTLNNTQGTIRAVGNITYNYLVMGY